jgi:hypothetical protein
MLGLSACGGGMLAGLLFAKQFVFQSEPDNLSLVLTLVTIVTLGLMSLPAVYKKSGCIFTLVFVLICSIIGAFFTAGIGITISILLSPLN